MAKRKFLIEMNQSTDRSSLRDAQANYRKSDAHVGLSEAKKIHAEADYRRAAGEGNIGMMFAIGFIAFVALIGAAMLFSSLK